MWILSPVTQHSRLLEPQVWPRRQPLRYAAQESFSLVHCYSHNFGSIHTSGILSCRADSGPPVCTFGDIYFAQKVGENSAKAQRGEFQRDNYGCLDLSRQQADPKIKWWYLKGVKSSPNTGTSGYLLGSSHPAFTAKNVRRVTKNYGHWQEPLKTVVDIWNMYFQACVLSKVWVC